MRKLDKLYDSLYDSIVAISSLLLIVVLSACIRGLQLYMNQSIIITDNIIKVCVFFIALIFTFLTAPIIIKINRIKSRYKKRLKEVYDDND